MTRTTSDWQAFWHAPPGRRFRTRFERHQVRDAHPAWRIARWIGGIALVVIGVVFMALPGPGIVPALAGLAVLAGESRRIADWADRVEVKVRSWRRRRRG